MYFNTGTIFTAALLLASEVAIASPAVTSDGKVLLTRAALTTDQQNALDAHNKARAGRSVPALQWDTDLQSAAQSYANTMASTGAFKHSGVGGENLFYERGGTYPNPLKDGTVAWLNEAPNYHNETIPQGSFESYGHYSMYCSRRSMIHGLTQARSSPMLVEGYHQGWRGFCHCLQRSRLCCR